MLIQTEPYRLQQFTPCEMWPIQSFSLQTEGEKPQRILHFCTHLSQIYLTIPLFSFRHLLHFPKHRYPRIKFTPKNRSSLSFLFFFFYLERSPLAASSTRQFPAQKRESKPHPQPPRSHHRFPSTRSLPSSCILSKAKWFYFLSI